jgi:acyl carrier protein
MSADIEPYRSDPQPKKEQTTMPSGIESGRPSGSGDERVVERLKWILADQDILELKPEEIDPDVSILEEGLGLDSLMLVEFIALLEEEFGFAFAEDDLNMEVFSSLRVLAGFIAQHTEAAA